MTENQEWKTSHPDDNPGEEHRTGFCPENFAVDPRLRFDFSRDCVQARIYPRFSLDSRFGIVSREDSGKTDVSAEYFPGTQDLRLYAWPLAYDGVPICVPLETAPHEFKSIVNAMEEVSRNEYGTDMQTAYITALQSTVEELADQAPDEQAENDDELEI